LEEETLRKIQREWKNQSDREMCENHASKSKPTFTIFLSSLSMQAMIAMGKLENPLTGETKTNYPQARFLIDTLQIIQEKTKNNLKPDEETLLTEYLYNLRMVYLEAKKSGGKNG